MNLPLKMPLYPGDLLIPNALQSFERRHRRIFEEIKAENFNTPDMWRMERFDWQLMFVYNEFLPGLRMHHLIEDPAVACSTGYFAYTRTKYVMWKRDVGLYSQPLLLNVEPIGRASPRAFVKGFLWAIRPKQYYALDRYMQNEVYYHRNRVEIDVPYREINNFDRRAVSEVKHEIVEAHMYIPIREYWEPLLDHGRVFKPVVPFYGHYFGLDGRKIDRPYYYWTKLESS
jgi:hypothetical protein